MSTNSPKSLKEYTLLVTVPVLLLAILLTGGFMTGAGASGLTPVASGKGALLSVPAEINVDSSNLQEASPLDSPAASCVSTGSITDEDPTQDGYVRRGGLPTTCLLPTSCMGRNSEPLHYDSYVFTNTASSAVCVNVILNGNCGSGSAGIYSTAYLESFDPDNICENYLADMGAFTTSGSYSVEVPAGQRLVVVVHEIEGGDGCDSYSLNVSGIECELLPTATLTTIPSATLGATSTSTVPPTDTVTTATIATSTATSTAASTETTTPSSTSISTLTSTATPTDVPPTETTTPATPGQTETPASATVTQTSSATTTTTATVITTETANPTNTPSPTSSATIGAGSPTSTSTSTVTISPTCISSGLVVGAITGSDTIMLGRLNRDSVVSSCPAPKTCPSILGTDQFHYDSYRYTNTTDQAQCFTVQLDAGSCVGTHYIFSAAYLENFDPNNICTGYLADIGASPNPTGSYSFNVPAGASFVVVVHELSTNSGCSGYGLIVTNCPTSVTSCLTTFTDVPPEQTFYPYVRCLACREILSGYADNTFRPGNNVTRAQIAKIVSNAAGFSDTPPNQMFEDVPPADTFYTWIARLAGRGYINGYPCGGPGEPCGPTNLPYFRSGNNASRGQISKIVVNAAGFIEPPGEPYFQDVPQGSTFYEWIQSLTQRNIIQGYPCGGQGEPCGNANLPYFRPNQNTTRGQAAKIVSSTFFPDCYSAGAQTTKGSSGTK